MNHESVLLNEVLDLLAPQPGESLLDVTLGLGGHSSAILKITQGSLVGVDADSQNLKDAEQNLESTPGKKTFIHSNFLNLPELDSEPVDMILADLGLSSPHLDEADRGFSFQAEGPLDMRFDRESGLTAAEWLARIPESDLKQAFWDFGELRSAPRLSRIIKEKLPQTTTELFACVEEVENFKAKDRAPQVFQAIRIALNQEMEALDTLLEFAPTLLKPGGRLAIISFHSLEDRKVKQAFKALTDPEIDDYTGQVKTEAPFVLLTKKPIAPAEPELTKNPRSRSAKLRGIKKI